MKKEIAICRSDNGLHIGGVKLRANGKIMCDKCWTRERPVDHAGVLKIASDLHLGYPQVTVDLSKNLARKFPRIWRVNFRKE